MAIVSGLLYGLGSGIAGGLAGRGLSALFDRGTNLDTSGGDREAGQIGSLLSQLQGMASEADSRSRASTQELLGNELDTQENRIREGAAGTERNLLRANMAGGGDRTGRTGGLLLGLTESMNTGIGDLRMRGERLAENMRTQSRGESRNLLAQIMQGRSGLLNRADNLAFQRSNLRNMRNQANSQMVTDFAGAGMNLFANLNNNVPATTPNLPY